MPISVFKHLLGADWFYDKCAGIGPIVPILLHSALIYWSCLEKIPINSHITSNGWHHPYSKPTLHSATIRFLISIQPLYRTIEHDLSEIEHFLLFYFIELNLFLHIYGRGEVDSEGLNVELLALAFLTLP